MSGLAVLIALLAGPLLQYMAASQPAMACCKRSRHACCKRKAQAKVGNPTLEAAPPCGTKCAKCCQASPSASPIVASRAPHVVARVEQITPLLLAGTGRLRPSPRSTSLFQRPPPPFLSL
ncbi:MAG: hypothetical protein JNK87_10035 [Bryobacterales bacterium]|nr:hypothetical protein [Bryobacterales bacterium]